MNNSDVANILKQDLERKEFIGVKTEIVLSSQGYVIMIVRLVNLLVIIFFKIVLIIMSVLLMIN